MPLPLFIVDAFAHKPFSGNPAAVCLLDRERDDGWLQSLAGEMNLSETAYVLPRGDDWALRWFTPTVEVDLCGHATLATSHILWETGRLKSDAPAIFHTRSGKLVCQRADRWIAMDFPAAPPREVEIIPDLIEGLGVRPTWVGRSHMDVIACLESEQAVRDLIPNQTALGRIKCRGILITAKSSGAYDFVSRSFFPRLGVPEDPVCGSAHCCLGPFWSERLGKTDLVGHQVSQRGGVVRVKCNGERVTLSGSAITVMRGEVEPLAA
jgi:PhzF family phenazine biosynthesis protein